MHEPVAFGLREIPRRLGQIQSSPRARGAVGVFTRLATITAVARLARAGKPDASRRPSIYGSS
eukprot:4906465-Pyramimonas_sp.AAC.1